MPRHEPIFRKRLMRASRQKDWDLIENNGGSQTFCQRVPSIYKYKEADTATRNQMYLALSDVAKAEFLSVLKLAFPNGV